ncbi:MAG: SCO family protein [Acidimicrobiia bacterium]|nr:SCO family protein [Acidimicrobiia bacterium]
MTATRRYLFAVGAGLALAAVAWFVVLPRFQPHAFTGTVIQSQTPAPGVELLTSTGERASLSDFEDQVLVLYFGYTFCPDECPTTLSGLKRAVDKLGGGAGDVQVIMVSVDPERDSPEVLGEYLGYFDPSFIGMTGTPEEIAAVAAAYGVFHQAEEGTVDTGYLVSHTARLMVIDRDGYLKLIMPADATPDQIAADLDYLL